MGFNFKKVFSGKAKVSCHPTDKGTLQCASYIEDKENNKRLLAKAEFNSSPNGEISTLTHEGDPDEIENLTLHAHKYAKKNQGEF